MDIFDTHSDAQDAAGDSQQVVGFYFDDEMQDRGYIVVNVWDSPAEVMHQVFQAKHKRTMTDLEVDILKFVEKQKGRPFARV